MDRSSLGRAVPGPTSIRAVFFDFGGTIVEEIDFDQWVASGRSLGLTLDPERLVHAWKEVEAIADRDPSVSVEAFCARVLSETIGQPVSADVVDRFLSLERSGPRAYRLYSDVVRCLDALRARRLELGILSNSLRSEAELRETIDRLGLRRYFRWVISSATEGVRKPSSELFRRAAERARLAPSEILYVGNLPETDARGAARAGLRSVWLHRDGTGFGDDPPEITSLLEVPLVLDRLAAGES